jgi:hypothetical protein
MVNGEWFECPCFHKVIHERLGKEVDCGCGHHKEAGAEEMRTVQANLPHSPTHEIRQQPVFVH